MSDYVVERDRQANDWHLKAEQQTVSRHSSEGAALIAAVRLAHAAAVKGQSSRVLRQLNDARWTEIASLVAPQEPAQET